MDWDPIDVWQRLRRSHPVHVNNSATSTGRMNRHGAKLFWISIAEYPDPLQDVLLLIAHARGYEAAIAALDQAIRAHLKARAALLPKRQAEPDTAARSCFRRVAS
jgi:hypothetical protein